MYTPFRPPANPFKSPSHTSSPPSFLVSSASNGTIASTSTSDSRHHSEEASSLSKRIRSKLPALAGRELSVGYASMPLGYLVVPSPNSSASRSRIGPQSSRAGQNARYPGSKPPPQPPPDDHQQAALMQNARQKLALRDQEAISKARSTMMENLGSKSSLNLNSAGSLNDQAHTSPAPNQLSPDQPTPTTEILPKDGEDTEAQRAPPAEELNPRPGPLNFTAEQLLPVKAAEPTHFPPQSDADYVIAVVGHAAVGKSSVIRSVSKAWGIPDPVISKYTGEYTVFSSFSQIQLGGKLQTTSKVEFLEADVTAVIASQEPTSSPASFLLNISGAILCYDSTKSETLRSIREALQLLSKSSIPTVVFACKSDLDVVRQVEAAHGNSLAEPFNIGLIEVSSRTAEGKNKMRNGIRWLLHKLEQQQEKQRQRKASLGRVISLSHSSSGRSAHSKEDISHNSIQTPPTVDPNTAGSRHDTPAPSFVQETESSARSSRSTSSRGRNRYVDGSTETSAASIGGKSQKNGDLQSTVLRNDSFGETSSVAELQLYTSVHDLFELLFSAITSATDDAFIRTFFLTYRRFCRPSEVMAHFVERYKAVDGNVNSVEDSHWAIMRLTGSLTEWVSRYPGDLCEPESQELFGEVVKMISQHNFIAHLTEDLLLIERSLYDLVDVDASWSLPVDQSRGTVTDVAINHLHDYEQELPGEHWETESDLTRTKTVSDHSLSKPNLAGASLPDTRIVAGQGLNPSGSRLLLPPNASSKSVLETSEVEGSPWPSALAYVLNSDPKVIAVELTKLQWELFKAIRPRDVLRHDLGKEPRTPVGRSISFFNHLSRWVTTLILANSKPKHRAQVYEQFMLISHHLRRLNDYESLYAVIAGMRETSVQRLSQTHQLVQPLAGIDKQFRNYVSLVDPSSGYLSYRIALQADLADDQAAIPLLMVTLGMVNRLQAARPEDRRANSCIQWDKFVKFGELLAVISECQAKVSMVSGTTSSKFRHILMETPVIMEEDALFERSTLLEPPVGRGTVAVERGGGNVLRRLASLGF